MIKTPSEFINKYLGNNVDGSHSSSRPSKMSEPMSESKEENLCVKSRAVPSKSSVKVEGEEKPTLQDTNFSFMHNGVPNQSLFFSPEDMFKIPKAADEANVEECEVRVLKFNMFMNVKLSAPTIISKM